MPPPPICAARPVHEAGSTTRKLIARPCELLSMGAMAPSIEQYARSVPALTHLGGARLTPATGSPMAEAGTVVPSRSLVQSSAEITLAAPAAGTWEDCALTDSTARTRTTAKPLRRFIISLLILSVGPTVQFQCGTPLRGL